MNGPTDVEVGLLPLNRSVTENETFPICVQITAGVLGCNITVPLEVLGGNSTLGEVGDVEGSCNGMEGTNSSNLTYSWL